MTASGRDADDEQRFADWVREHGSAIRGFLVAMVRRWDVVDELSQEVFCRAWQARSRYREQGTPRAYLLQIADRLACDHVRRSGAQVHLDEAGWTQLEPASQTAEPWQEIQRAEDTEELCMALDRLSVAQRRVLLLRYYGQFSFAEIAEMTGWPLNTALSHCRRGLEALRKLLVEQQS
jgi:RNA polymerase sigma-70 factor (ECF subfamily)